MIPNIGRNNAIAARVGLEGTAGMRGDAAGGFLRRNGDTEPVPLELMLVRKARPPAISSQTQMASAGRYIRRGYLQIPKRGMSRPQITPVKGNG